MGSRFSSRPWLIGARALALSLLLGGTIAGAVHTGRAANADYPELDIIATDQGIQAPSITFAARYRVVFKNEGTKDHGLFGDRFSHRMGKRSKTRSLGRRNRMLTSSRIPSGSEGLEKLTGRQNRSDC